MAKILRLRPQTLPRRERPRRKGETAAESVARYERAMARYNKRMGDAAYRRLPGSMTQ